MNWRADLERLIAAIERAEGGSDALVRAVQYGVPTVTNYYEAYAVAKNTIVHALWDYAMRDPDAFIQFLGNRWAPIGAGNDPNNLNAHWVKNVQEIYSQRT